MRCGGGASKPPTLRRWKISGGYAIALLVISMEDILGIREQVNLPGTTSEHPNWRQRLPVLLEDLKNQAGLMP
jgi:4-alpha-glucanotransferase